MFLVEDYLAHHGVLGMKWGVERQKAAAGNKGAQKKLAKADVSWEKELNSTKGFLTVHNGVADKMNNGLIKQFNATHKSSGNLDDNSPQTKAYLSAYEKLYNKTFAETVKENYGESPSGKLKAVVKTDSSGPYVTIVKASAEHGDISDWRIPLKVTNGQIVGFGTPTDSSMAHSEEFLAHFGVLGMKWGHRNPDSQREEAMDPHEDHVKAHVLDKKPVKTLSNKDLQTVNQRLQLEQQYSKLKGNSGALKQIKKGDETVKTVIGVIGTTTAAVGLTMKFVKSEPGQIVIAKGARFVGKVIGRT